MTLGLTLETQNGQGKSTIAKLILGTLLPTKGKITRHPLLKIGYFAQHSVEELSTGPAVTPSSATAAPPTALSHFLKHFKEKGEKVVEQDARQCLGSFGLQGKVASDTPLVLLSGGQKVRLVSLLRNTGLTSRLLVAGPTRVGPPRLPSSRLAVRISSIPELNTLAESLFVRLLDEVTTHVDAPTISALSLALRQFAGAIVLITHDRYVCSQFGWTDS